MPIETREDVETFLWSLCQGYNEENSKETEEQLARLRKVLKVYINNDRYSRCCMSTLEKDRTCFKRTDVDEIRCGHHCPRTHVGR